MEVRYSLLHYYTLGCTYVLINHCLRNICNQGVPLSSSLKLPADANHCAVYIAYSMDISILKRKET